MKIIGIAGAAGSGKGEFARALRRRIEARGERAFILPMAAELKRIAREQFGWDGKKDDRGRRLLQILGTEAGRGYNQNIWVDKWIMEAEKAADHGHSYIVCDDIRFDNEAEMVEERGGILVRMIGRGYELGPNSGHASESSISSRMGDLFHLMNNQEGTTIDQLDLAADRLLDMYELFRSEKEE